MQALLAGCSLCRAHGRLFSQDFCSLVSRLQPRTPVFAAMSCSHHCLSSDTPQFFMALALHQGGTQKFPRKSEGHLRLTRVCSLGKWGGPETMQQAVFSSFYLEKDTKAANSRADSLQALRAYSQALPSWTERCQCLLVP